MERTHPQSNSELRDRLVLAEEILASEQADVLLTNVQRLAGIGALTTSVAQELVDLLSVVTAASNGLQYELQHHEGDSLEALQHYMDLIERNAFRSAHLASVLREYGALDGLQMAVTDIDTILRDTLLLVERQFREDSDIAIAVDQPRESRSLVCDHNRIIQLLLILLINARDAMVPEGGRIELRVRRIQVGEKIALPGLEYLPEDSGERIAFTVTDQGPGIPCGLQEHVFTPFFSTHAGGAGIGLGLSVAQNIVRQHNGRIWVTNNNGPTKGATFVVVFPVRPSD